MKSPTMGTPTATCADFVSSTRLEDLPAVVVERSKLAILDTVGVTLAGIETRTAAVVRQFAAASGGPPRATILGTADRTDPATAAFVNGTVGHALDYDDVSWSMIGHPSVAILPAVLALAEDHGASGSRVLTAYAVGFEVAAKLGEALNPSHYERGFHATGTLGTLGAAAAAANLLGFNSTQVANALGIAASLASGLRQNFGTDTKPLHAGQAARNGIVAAELTRCGFTASTEILNSRWGFANVFADLDEPEPSLGPIGALADPWEIAGTGLLIKAYPSCVSTHTGIDSALRLRRDNRIDWSSIERIDVGVVHLTTKILIHNRPVTGLEGKFSMPYCISRALLDGSVKIVDFSDEQVNQPSAQELLRKVDMRVDERVDSEWRVGRPRGAIVTITLKNGQELTTRTDVPSGTGKNLVREVVLSKFYDCFEQRANHERWAAMRLSDALLRLESADTINQIMQAAT